MTERRTLLAVAFLLPFPIRGLVALAARKSGFHSN